jgi:hypothetical protein
MVKADPIPLSAPCPRRRKPSNSVGASTWQSVAGAAGLVLVGAGFGLALALSLP